MQVVPVHMYSNYFSGTLFRRAPGQQGSAGPRLQLARVPQNLRAPGYYYSS